MWSDHSYIYIYMMTSPVFTLQRRRLISFHFYPVAINKRNYYFLFHLSQPTRSTVLPWSNSTSFTFISPPIPHLFLVSLNPPHSITKCSTFSSTDSYRKQTTASPEYLFLYLSFRVLVRRRLMITGQLWKSNVINLWKYHTYVFEILVSKLP